MNRDYHGITIDLSKDRLFADYSKTLLDKYYLKDGEKSPQEAFARTALAYCNGDLELAQRIYGYASNKWLGFASPVLSNAPIPGQKSKGLPISCFLLYVPDTVQGLIDHTSELRWLSVKGGGVGGHWNDVRSACEKSSGVIPFLKTVDSDMLAWRQGKTRKGAYAAYMDVSHPEILEFIEMRGQGRDDNRTCKNLNNAVNITDDFINAVENDLDWNLVDPATKEIKDTFKARRLWEKVLLTRARHGEPYINYIDEANRRLNPVLKSNGLKINGSNLCNEIHLPTDDKRTAVCCLSSLNLEFYDEWKDTTIVEDLVEFLDNVLQHFIDNAPDDISRARFSATQERSIGVGVMGFHTFLQRKGVPFESVMAKSWNKNIFKLIKERANKSSEKLGIIKGNFPDCKEIEKLENISSEFEGAIKRNAHLIAVAPTANNAMILDVSPSIEPYAANIYIQRSRIGAQKIVAKYLFKLLEEKFEELKSSLDISFDEWLMDQYSSIINNMGSVQQLEYLTEDEKATFKTAYEIDQRWVIDHARDRQEFIDQGQSVNLFFPSESTKEEVNMIHLRAFSQKGTGVPLKGLYYYRTKAGSRAENVNKKVERKALEEDKEASSEECLSCHS